MLLLKKFARNVNSLFFYSMRYFFKNFFFSCDVISKSKTMCASAPPVILWWCGGEKNLLKENCIFLKQIWVTQCRAHHLHIIHQELGHTTMVFRLKKTTNNICFFNFFKVFLFLLKIIFWVTEIIHQLSSKYIYTWGTDDVQVNCNWK